MLSSMSEKNLVPIKIVVGDIKKGNESCIDHSLLKSRVQEAKIDI